MVIFSHFAEPFDGFSLDRAPNGREKPKTGEKWLENRPEKLAKYLGKKENDKFPLFLTHFPLQNPH